MFFHEMKRVFQRLGVDKRGAEMLETIAKIAFIALPILAIFLYTMKTFNAKYKDEGTRVKTQETDAKTSTDNAVGALQ